MSTHKVPYEGFDPDLLGDSVWHSDDPTLEMPVSAETQNTPDLPQLTPGEQQVLEAITFPAGLQRRLHEEFKSAITEEVETCVDPNDAELIKTVASIIEWQWFAGRGDPLPEGIALNNQGRQVPKSKYAATNMNRVISHLEDGVLAPVRAHKAAIMEAFDTKPKLIEALSVVCRESDMYKLLHAVASDAPAAEDLPLSLAQRMMRETQIEQDVRRRHALAQHDTLRHHPNAHQELQRGLYHLDDETERRVSPQQLDARERLLAFLVDEFNACGYRDWETQEPIGPVQSFCIKTGQEGELYAKDCDGQDIYIDGDLLCDFTLKVSRSISSSSGLERYADNEWIIYYLLPKLLDPKNDSKTALELLYESSYGIEAEDALSITGDVQQDILSYLRGVESDIISIPYEEELWPTWVKTPQESSIEVHDRESLKREQDKIIGVVTGGSRLVANHLLIGSNSRQAEYPARIDDYDLKIEIYDHMVSFNYYTFEGLSRSKGIPFIPGFELVAVDTTSNVNQFYFKRADVDPYNGSAGVMIDTDRVEAVIRQCHEIGLTVLAKKLEVAGDLSLADLTRYISQSSDYTFDRRYEYLGENTKFTAEDFRGLVNKEGRLQVQCTGAQAFLEFILNAALPGSHCSTISGNVIESTGYISTAGHAQTLLSYRGEQYILDATPSLNHEHGLRGARGGRGPFLYENQAKASRILPDDGTGLTTQPTAEQLSQTDEVMVDSTSTEQRRKMEQARAENVAEWTKKLFKAHFNLSQASSDDVLYRRILKLKKDADPISKTMSLILRSETEVIASELQSVQEYIANLKKAEPAIFKRIGIPHYNQVMFDSLVSILKDLELKITTSLQGRGSLVD